MRLLHKTNGSTAALDAERDQLHLWMRQTMSHSSLLITSNKKFKSCLVVFGQLFVGKWVLKKGNSSMDVDTDGGK